MDEAADGMLEARIAETGAGHHVGLGKLARDPLTSDDDETVITTGNPKPDDLTDNAEASSNNVTLYQLFSFSFA